MRENAYIALKELETVFILRALQVRKANESRENNKHGLNIRDKGHANMQDNLVFLHVFKLTSCKIQG